MFITIILKWYYSHGQSQICMCALYFTLDYIFTVYLLQVNVRKNIVPSSEAEWDNIDKEFMEKWNFPNCLVALEGKQVVQAPFITGSYF